ncbi:MAG TPA: hypothetical protein VLC54_02260 [Anaeromyxobacter sp.]|nr:hypothetical protein [Anaeromyxobacter sp.]
MLSVTSSGAGASAASIPPAAGEPDRSSVLRTAAAAAARGLAELAIDTVAPQIAKAAKTTKAKTSSSAPAKRSTASKSSGAGYAKKTSTASSKASSKSADPLAFLSDPKLSIEDKLMQLLAHLNARYEEQMKQHMDVLAGKTSSAKTTSGSKSGSSGTTKKKGGLFGTLASVVSKAFPGAGAIVDVLKDKTFQAALKKLGGPVLAAGASALGFPALAPALMKLGPQLASGALDLAKAIDAETKSTSSSASKASSAASGKTELSSSEQQLELMKLQQLQEKQKEMFSMVSAIFRMQHETRSTVIGNIR